MPAGPSTEPATPTLTLHLAYTKAAYRLIAIKAAADPACSFEHMNGKVLSELLEIFDDAREAPDVRDRLIFHTVFFNTGRVEDEALVVYPGDKANTLVVDAAEYETSDKPLEAGPLKGLKLSIPRPESE